MPQLWLLAATILLGAAAATPTPHVAVAHSFLTVPLPISHLAGCRIGGSGRDAVIGNCGGPCPNSEFRADSSAANPAAIYRRGGRYEVRWTRNNHEGGFIRWALVPVAQMYEHSAHSRNAFHWSCWAINRFQCGEMDKYRDCDFDRRGEAFRDWLTIPAVFPDGDYMLGWTWYGGGEGDTGHFGDYYDCSFVRVQGGAPLAKTHKPTFAGGACLATVNRLGVCKREPCVPMRKVVLRKPVEFDRGAKPRLIQSSAIPSKGRNRKYAITGQSAFSETAAGLRRSPVRVYNLRLINVHTRTALPHLPLGRRPIILGPGAKFSLRADTTSNVRWVQWFVNGVRKFSDSTHPFTSAGDDHTGFYAWRYPVINRRVYVSVRAQGAGGQQDWYSQDLQFRRDNRKPQNYIGF